MACRARCGSVPQIECEISIYVAGMVGGESGRQLYDGLPPGGSGTSPGGKRRLIRGGGGGGGVSRPDQ